MRHALVRIAFCLAAFGLARVAAPAPVAAQTGKLTGVVKDQATGQPLEGVEVMIEGTGLSTFTAASGRFFLVSVPPGTYTITARRVGYQPVAQRGVNVAIDVTREVDFSLNPAQAATVQTVTIEAQAVPLVQPGVSSSTIGISGDVIRALPVVSIEGALKLQQGFLQVPSNTDIISFTESRRDPTNPISIRGGRAGETLTMIDGIPVNNYIFGGPAISPDPEAVNQLDFIKGGMEPQYGNALSGIINVATKDGGQDLAGSVRYQSSAVGGWLGDKQDDLQHYGLADGFLSGSVPGTDKKLRFLVSGRQERGADAVYQFDNSIAVPSTRPDANPSALNEANFLDVFPGWRGFGFNNTQQVIGKLTYFVRPTLKVGFLTIDEQQQRKPFDFDFLLTYDNPLSSPGFTTLGDSVALLNNRYGSRVSPTDFGKTVEGSINAGRRLYVGRVEDIVGHTSYDLAVGRMLLNRVTCNYWQGICLGTNFGEPNFTDDQFLSPLAGQCSTHPTCGTDQFYGGETLKSWIFRGDVQSQVSDHHNLQAGAMILSHDVTEDEFQKVGQNIPNPYHNNYHATPWDAALYAQDRIEYDFLTVKLGVRFDLGSAGGRFWVNPLDPTNGTTAADVCANPSQWQNVTVDEYDQTTGTSKNVKISANPAWSSLGVNCVNLGTGKIDPAVLDSAAKIASSDDFAQSKKRRQFSPRIGVNFPLGPSSAVYFNFGRYTQNPLLNNLFVATGIGTPTEGTTAGPVLQIPGGVSTPFLGNPSLLTEQTTSYEVGYSTELGDDYALGVVLFSKNQIGLTGLRTGGIINGAQIFDPGATYQSSTPSYRILVNQDFQTVRGAELQFRRRVTNHWGFDLNYSLSEARTNASNPEKEFERQIGQGDPTLTTEQLSDIDQPSVFNAALIFQVGQDAPAGWLGDVVRDISTSLTFRSASGLPYTPTKDFFGFGLSELTRNTGRGPSTFQVDWQLSKNFQISNLRYGLVVLVQNLTDRQNCVQVYVTTGQCTQGAVDVARERNGNPVAADAITSTFLDRPQYFGARRSVQAGLRVSF
ncbi:MAG TPA: TonB-dependent receptor [Gemmatimonadales bacterium]|nr:TonB-dependent receptor [Gemmatimonadales bacterium]